MLYKHHPNPETLQKFATKKLSNLVTTAAGWDLNAGLPNFLLYLLFLAARGLRCCVWAF